MTRIPVACTLDGSDAQLRIADWRKTLTGLVSSTERTEPTVLRMTLGEDSVRVARVIELARAEQQCCAFFSFGLDIRAENVTLVVKTAPGSEPTLDEFSRLAGV